MQVDPNGPNPVSGPSPSPAVSGAIRQAAKATGANFQYLLATAQVESNYNPNAQGATSSAKGLFQFIEQTWLATLKESGPALGYGKVADAIGRNATGQFVVTDPKLSDKIMNLRADPTANSVMAGAFTKNNSAKLGERLGRNPTEGELYIAHFLGPAGASRLIGLAESKPGLRAADAFPGAAQANPSIFYNRQGGARSIGDVYQTLIGRYSVARASPANTAAAPVVAAAKAMPTAQPAKVAAFAPDTAQLSETFAQAAKLASAPEPPDNRPVFHSLFSVSGRQGALAPIVNSLWGSPQASAAPPQAQQPPLANVSAVPVLATAESRAPVPPPVAAPAFPKPPPSSGPLDLFQDAATDARALFRGRV